MARKDSKSWTKMNDLSGNMRGAITEISINQPGAPLLHYYGIREPRGINSCLRIGSLSNKVKEKKYTYVSLIPLVITKQEKQIYT